MQTLALTHAQLRAIASVTVFASRDDVTPVIGGVRLELTAGRILATATDRYRVAELSFDVNTLGDACTDAEILETRADGFDAITLPSAFLARVVKQLPRKPAVPNPTIAMMVTDEGHRVTLRDRIAGFESSDGPIGGNYPPVARLFPETLENVTPAAERIRLNAAFLASLEKLSLPSDIGARSFEKVYTITTQLEEEAIGGRTPKPKPVIFTRDNGPRPESLESIRAMIQPNILFR